MDFLIHWPPGPVVATVQCQGLVIIEFMQLLNFIFSENVTGVTVEWLYSFMVHKSIQTSHLSKTSHKRCGMINEMKYLEQDSGSTSLVVQSM